MVEEAKELLPSFIVPLARCLWLLTKVVGNLLGGGSNYSIASYFLGKKLTTFWLNLHCFSSLKLTGQQSHQSGWFTSFWTSAAVLAPLEGSKISMWSLLHWILDLQGPHRTCCLQSEYFNLTEDPEIKEKEVVLWPGSCQSKQLLINWKDCLSKEINQTPITLRVRSPWHGPFCLASFLARWRRGGEWEESKVEGGIGKIMEFIFPDKPRYLREILSDRFWMQNFVDQEEKSQFIRFIPHTVPSDRRPIMSITDGKM